MNLTSDLYQRLQAILLRCGPFTTDRTLRPVFVDARLAPWRDTLPEAANALERVRAVIAALVDQADAQGENALVLLLRVLSENTSPGDACHWDLADLAQDVAQEVGAAAAAHPARATSPAVSGQPAGTQINLSGTFSGPVSIGGGDAVDLRSSQGAVVNPQGPVTQTFNGAPPATQQGAPMDMAALRVRLNRMDDVGIDSLCLDRFPEVFDRFSRGMRRDEKVNLLLDYIRRNPEKAGMV